MITNTDGYYQEKDEFFNDVFDEDDDYEYNHMPNIYITNVKRYEEIKNLSPKQFARERENIHKNQSESFLSDKERLSKALKKSHEIYKCATCKCAFSARKADRARGWARYCSKSCKAQSAQNKKAYNNLLNAIS